MLYVASIKDIMSLPEKEAEKLKIGASDSLALIEPSESGSVSIKDTIWLLSHVQAKETKLIIKDSPAALVALGALMAKSAQTTIIGNPFGMTDKEKTACFEEALKGHKVIYFGMSKPRQRKITAVTEPVKQEKMAVIKEVKEAVKETVAPAAPKEPVAKFEKPKAQKVTAKKAQKTDGLFKRLGIDSKEVNEADEKVLEEIIAKSEDFNSFRKAVFAKFESRSGIIMLKTSSKTIEELKACLR